MTAQTAERYHCGPLDLIVTSHSDILRNKVADTLDLYNVEWPGTRLKLHIAIEADDEPQTLGPGKYLECARMNVDHAPDARGTLVATCRSGIHARGNPRDGRWSFFVSDADDPWVLTDMESLLSLVLTEGWRAAGWVPVHAASVIRGETCAMICAESGGGKTTLTAALVRRGWRTLGDDKLLLRISESGTPELRALVHTFNLHPRTQAWFPEVGDLEQLPVYSEWTEKRKVNPESIWAGTTENRATPTHLVQIRRVKTEKSVSVSSMQGAEVLSALLHQAAVPSDSLIAKHVLTTVVATASQLTGLSVELGENAYDDADCLASLEQALA